MSNATHSSPSMSKWFDTKSSSASERLTPKSSSSSWKAAKDIYKIDYNQHNNKKRAKPTLPSRSARPTNERASARTGRSGSCGARRWSSSRALRNKADNCRQYCTKASPSSLPDKLASLSALQFKFSEHRERILHLTCADQHPDLTLVEHLLQPHEQVIFAWANPQFLTKYYPFHHI